jgi:hypothetical protein
MWYWSSPIRCLCQGRFASSHFSRSISPAHAANQIAGNQKLVYTNKKLTWESNLQQTALPLAMYRVKVDLSINYFRSNETPGVIVRAGTG